jgi:hypothetical protein
LLRRIPLEHLTRLPLYTKFFAPSPGLLGIVERDYGRKPREVGVRIYLAPILEGLPQEVVDFTVAHEVAHAVLGHWKFANPLKAFVLRNGVPVRELDADKLARKWGFERFLKEGTWKIETQARFTRSRTRSASAPGRVAAAYIDRSSKRRTGKTS